MIPCDSAARGFSNQGDFMPIETPLHNSEASLPECRAVAAAIIFAARGLEPDDIAAALEAGFQVAGLTAAHLELLVVKAVRELDAIWQTKRRKGLVP
jgi:hypothetical protein